MLGAVPETVPVPVHHGKVGSKRKPPLALFLAYPTRWGGDVASEEEKETVLFSPFRLLPWLS